jgi:hypothetical protein
VFLSTSGSGIDRLRLPVTVAVVAPIAASPEVVRFGDVKVGAATEQKVILQGNAPFKVTAVKGGEGVKAEALAQDARPVHVIKVELTPGAIGDHSSSLEVTTDNPEQPTVLVPLVGKVAK